MGQGLSVEASDTYVKINYEDVQEASKVRFKQLRCVMINTLRLEEQECLIYGTLPANKEEMIINHLIKIGRKECFLIVYGKNSNDETAYRKYAQLKKLGFKNVGIYVGGMFEWLLLQDIYGEKEFPTTKRELNILRFKPGGFMTSASLESSPMELITDKHLLGI